ncbi:MAG: AAA family ATPase [Candidatus Nanoarchaeia archaeon]|nr:AAA family ATPase [Candidatus Nanoarchaeia archaeon]
MGIFDQIVWEKSVFRNEGVLDYTYMPSQVLFRENEQKEIVGSLKPLIFDRLPRNMYIYGQPGVGKTVCVKKVLEDLGEFTSDIYSTYVDLWSYRTTNAIYTEIARQMKMPFVSGRSSEFIAERIKERITAKKGAVFVFDEVDKAKDQMFLYNVLTNFDKVCTIIITNDQTYMQAVDARISSRLTPYYMEFKPYTIEQINEILAERKRAAFMSGVMPEEAFDLIVEETFKYNDIRLGLFLLSESGKIADYNNSDKISADYVSEAVKRIGTFKNKTSSVGLNKEEKTILNIVGENQGLTTSELYGLYVERGGSLSERSLRRYLEKLSSINMVNVNEIRGGIRGRSFQVFIK